MNVRMAAITGFVALMATGCGAAVETTEREPDAAESEAGITTTDRNASPSEPVPEPSSEPAVTGGAAVADYFRALSSQRPSEMQRMVRLSAPNSPARTYAQVQIAYAAAQRAEMGSAGPPRTMEVADGEIETCTEPVGVYAEDAEQCFQFSGFETTEGKLASFKAGGKTIDKRLAKGGQTIEVGGTEVTLLGAYHSAEADLLIVAFEAEPGDQQISVEWYSAEYIDPDGATVASIAAYGPDPLRKGRQNIAVAMFEQTPVGGTVVLPGYDADYSTLPELQFDL